MRILGVDPGLKTVGIGLVDMTGRTPTALDWLTIETATGLTLAMRLEEIQKDLADYIRQHRPDLAVVEKLYFSTNKKTAFAVAQARGAILLTLQQAAIPIIEITPLQLKMSIAGHGKADKLQLQMMVQRALRLQEIPRPDDAADALALALYGAYTYRPSLQSTPKKE